MIITYYGGLCVKAQIGDVSVAINPPLRSDGKSPRFSTNIALFSTKEKDQHFTHGGASSDTFIIDGPGEYEVGGIFIRGINTEEISGENKKINTAYSILFDDISLCHLGAITVSELKPEAREFLGSIDILFVPITGDGKITPACATKLSTSLEPNIIIPLYDVGVGSHKESLRLFLREEGSEGIESIDKLTIRKKDIAGRDEKVVVLSPTS